MLLYDHREDKSGIPALLTFADIPIERHQLPVGDFQISEQLIVERKTTVDFVASLKDRRLFEQVTRMQASFPRSVLIIEGDKILFPEKSWRGAVSSIIRKGTNVLFTADIEESSQWLALFYNQENTTKKARPIGNRKKITSDDQALLYALAVVPGISVNLAEQLLAYFGSLINICSATPQELQQVEGIGKKRSQEIHRILNHRWKETPF